MMFVGIQKTILVSIKGTASLELSTAFRKEVVLRTCAARDEYPGALGEIECPGT